jgi:hypothetical protein
MDDDDKPRISGKTATHVAMEAAKRGPIRVDQVATEAPVPADGRQIAAGREGAPDSVPLPEGAATEPRVVLLASLPSMGRANQFAGINP